jgi:16S rRNA (uracil1498-N3)-methyltransferase
MSHRVYTNCSLGAEPVIIEGPEAHHLVSVCRVRPGDQVCLFNGNGKQYLGRVQELTRRTVTVQVLEEESPQRELRYRLEVAAPLPKGDRAQFLLEKLTELGVTQFVPLETERSVVSPGSNRLQKLERYVIEASKQSGRNVLLQVKPAQSWHSYYQNPELPPVRFLAHPGSPPGTVKSGQDMVMAVGPEGGFTEEEIIQACSAGWQLIGLGPRILRVETAAIVFAVWGAEMRH